MQQKLPTKGIVHSRIGFGEPQLLKVFSPFGVEASLKAVAELRAGDVAECATLSSKLEQLEYEARKAFEQYDAVDARNRLVAGELERRWNEKLEEVELTKRDLADLDTQRHLLSPDEEARIRWMGENFAEVWQSNHCPPTLKKMIFRTALEEIIVRADAENKPGQKRSLPDPEGMIFSSTPVLLNSDFS